MFKEKKLLNETFIIYIMNIKHLIIPSGGPAGFVTYGALRELAKKKVWNIENIKSIYGCSVGALIGAVLALNYKWEWLDDFFYKRPWSDVVKINPENVINFYKTKGLLDNDTFYKIMDPLLKGKGMTQNITMGDFYAKTNIDLHIYTTNLNSTELETIDINHKTYPDIELCNAITMSASIPGIMSPIFLDNKCLIDGGCLNNFPIGDCLKEKNVNIDEILAFTNIWKKGKNITEESHIGDIYLKLIWALVKKANILLNDKFIKKIKHNVYLNATDATNFSSWSVILENKDVRASLIEQGIINAKMFCKYNNL
jgi:predicted acylesterase/phospholipase RssA